MVDTEEVAKNQVLEESDCFSKVYLIFCKWLWYKWLCFIGRECEMLSCMWDESDRCGVKCKWLT